MKRFLIFILISVASTILAVAQSGEVIREYNAENIKTIQFFRKGFPLSYPILETGDENPLTLSFDDLSDSPKNYYYTITLCNADWTESRLSPSEYSSGMFSYSISNYKVSSNTIIHYYHYELDLPNSDFQLNLPGNYIIKVFEDNNSDNPILLKRFAFVNSKVNITGLYKIPSLPEFRVGSQQVNFTIENSDFPISNPASEVKVVILKNFDWNTALTNLKPLFIGNGYLDYSYDRENLFVAGNEYRSFNINSRKYPSPQVTGIDYDGRNYNATLATDKPRNRYSYKEDINGLFYIENKDINNPDNTIESDYFQVKLSLNANIIPSEGEIFVYGALTNYRFTPDAQMIYDSEKNIYETTLFLKQGYYEYQYVFLPKKQGSFNETEVEGSFSETENNYFILVYYRGFGERYDRLIGYKRITAVK